MKIGLIFGGCVLFAMCLMCLGVFTFMGDVSPSASQKEKTASKVTSPRSKQKEENVIKVDALTLSNAYEANELKADQAYKGKLVEVTGTVEDISKMLGITSVSLTGSNFMYSINCVFPKENESQVATLAKDTQTTILGYVDGYGISIDISKCSVK